MRKIFIGSANAIKGKRTVEDRTSEETEELQEQVFLLSGDLVPAESLAASLNISVGDTLLDVGLEPLRRHGTILREGARALLLPEL